MGKSTLSMAIFNSYVCLPEGNDRYNCIFAVQYVTCDILWSCFQIANIMWYITFCMQ